MKEQYDLAKWLAGGMSESELAAFRNTPDYAAYAKIVDVSAKLQAPSFNEDEIYRNVREVKTSAKVIPLYNRTWYRIAAMLVLFLGLAWILKSYLPQTVSSDNAQNTTCMLPDNSMVTLNASSDISYKKWNWDNDRRINLTGEAYFRVAKGKKFEVKTNLGKVSVLGTQFDVKARKNRFDVTCYEGRVRVDYNSTTVIITKGQHVAFANGNAIDIPNTISTAPEWINKELSFQKENLKNILDEIERQYNVKIELKATADQLFTGTLPLDNLDEALQILTSTFHLKALKENGKIILVAVNGQ